MGAILALEGASNRDIQAAMAGFVARWSARGVRIAGVLEIHPGGGGAGHPRDHLRDIATGRIYPLYQDLGPGSTSCRISGGGLADACAALGPQIAAGCDLAVLSKFGKLEAARGGLGQAFAAAVEAGVPVLTAVAPRFAAEWRAFAGPLAVAGPPDAGVLDAWWHGFGRRSPA